MITNHDRSGFFGASDTSFVVAKNRLTKSWQKWWLEKLDLHKSQFSTKAMAAGSAWEHRILSAINPKIRKDHQVVIEKYRLRVNYDGDMDNVIHEVKTYNYDKEFKVTTGYWRQAQVEMFAWYKKYKVIPKMYIDAYGLIPEEYENYFLPVDDKRLGSHEIEYDKQWIQNEYLPKLKELCRALRKRRFPT